MLDYEEYGASFRQPRALRDDGGPAYNDFNRYDGTASTTEGRPRTALPDEEEARRRKTLAAVAAPSVGAAVAQQPQTFAQMQAAGLPRPPAPTTVLPTYPQPSTGITDIVKAGGGVSDGGGSMYDPTTPLFQPAAPTTGDGPPPASSPTTSAMEDSLRRAWEGYTPTAFGTGKDPAMQEQIRSVLMAALGSPSRYDTDVAKQSFDMLAGDIDDDYNARDERLKESIASRGLGAIGDGTIGTSDQRFQNLQRRSAKQRIATDLLREQANTYGTDRSAAIRDAMGYGNDQFSNELAGATFNANERQRAYQNYTGYGQQAFENQMTTAQMRDRQQMAQLELLLKLLGLA